MASAINYRRWIFSKVQPFLGPRILEVGGGIGNFTEMFPKAAHIVTVEPHPECAAHLRGRFAGEKQIEVVESGLEGLQTERRFDTIVCLNVLEHIEDDREAIRKMASLLAPSGRLVLMLPANKLLFGPVDLMLRHYRRYGRSDTKRLLCDAGLRIEVFQNMNFVGFFGWLVNARILKRAAQSPDQVAFFDKFVVPVVRRVESVVPPPFGQSLFAAASFSG